MKENNKDWLIAILGVIIGVLLVGNGVLFYLKNRDLSKEEDNTSTKEETKEEKVLSLDSDIVKELSSYIVRKKYIYMDNDLGYYQNKRISYSDFDDASRLKYAYLSLVETLNYDANDLAMVEVLGENGNCGVYDSYYFVDYNSKTNESLYSLCLNKEAIWVNKLINKELLEKQYKKIYGMDKTVPKLSFIVTPGEYCAYSSKNDNYVCLSYDGWGTAGNDYYKATIEKAIENNGVIELYDNLEYWKVSSNQVSRNKYKHIFKLDASGNYYWVSSEVEE